MPLIKITEVLISAATLDAEVDPNDARVVCL